MTLTPGGATCYVERSKVREILITSDVDNESTQAVLQEVDALPIFVAADFSPDSKLEAYRKALEEILAAEKEFREGMPPGWEGDPLTDACEAARKALAAGG